MCKGGCSEIRTLLCDLRLSDLTRTRMQKETDMSGSTSPDHLGIPVEAHPPWEKSNSVYIRLNVVLQANLASFLAVANLQQQVSVEISGRGYAVTIIVSSSGYPNVGRQSTAHATRGSACQHTAGIGWYA